VAKSENEIYIEDCFATFAAKSAYCSCGYFQRIEKYRKINIMT